MCNSWLVFERRKVESQLMKGKQRPEAVAVDILIDDKHLELFIRIARENISNRNSP